MTTTAFIICMAALLPALIFILYWLIGLIMAEFSEGHCAAGVAMIVLAVLMVAATLPWCWL